MTRFFEDFRMEVNTVPAVRRCDVCTSMCEGDRISTFVGITAQSDVCMDCARDITKIAKIMPVGVA